MNRRQFLAIAAAAPAVALLPAAELKKGDVLTIASEYVVNPVPVLQWTFPPGTVIEALWHWRGRTFCCVQRPSLGGRCIYELLPENTISVLKPIDHGEMLIYAGDNSDQSDSPYWVLGRPVYVGEEFSILTRPQADYSFAAAQDPSRWDVDPDTARALLG